MCSGGKNAEYFASFYFSSVEGHHGGDHTKGKSYNVVPIGLLFRRACMIFPELVTNARGMGRSLGIKKC